MGSLLARRTHPPDPRAAGSARRRGRRGKVLVLGHDTRSFLSVVRSLGRHGLEVHAAWCPPESPAAQSRYLARRHDLPWPSAGDGPWQLELSELLERERFDLVLPTNDPTLIPLQRHRSRFERLSRIAVPDDRTFAIAFDKIRTHDLAESLGVPVPRSVVVREAAEIDAALADFPYPVVVKPQASYLPEDLQERGYVRRARTSAEARKAVQGLLVRGDVMIQENVPGVGHGYELLAERGEILMRFEHERVHEPPHGGWSSYRRSTPITPEFEAAAGRLMRAMGHTGVAMVEFRRDPSSGRWVLIEVNARFWGSLPLALAAGADFPVALWELLVHDRRPRPGRYRTNVYARNLRSDLRWLWLNARADRHDPALTTRPPWAVAGEAANVLRGRERNDTFVLDDLAPARSELLGLGARVVRSGAVGARGRVAGQPRLARRRRDRARAALAQAESVLFVCRGNICRSPFAARYADRVFGGAKRFRSAGVLSLPGRPSPLVARAVAAEYAVDLDDHRSTALSAELVAEADLVLVFDDANRRELLSRFPAARRRVALLGALADGGPPTISDPLDRGERVYRQVYGRIADALSACDGAREGVATATPSRP